MIDLHTHTDESDGSYSPPELVRQAAAAGLRDLAITDHDTFSGFDMARDEAAAAAINLICGIEVSTKWDGRTVHLLGYFPEGPSADFRGWIRDMQESRRDRNRRLVARLRTFGMDLNLEEIEARGRNMTGRPHFARVMLDKGYVRSIREAFDEYLDESAKGYVDRREPQLSEAVARIRAGGGISSIAHPVRLTRDPARLAALVEDMRAHGLDAIEVWHSDHGEAEVAEYLAIAERFGLKATGGSDFHGDTKPEARLGAVQVPRSALDAIRRVAAR